MERKIIFTLVAVLVAGVIYYFVALTPQNNSRNKSLSSDVPTTSVSGEVVKQNARALIEAVTIAYASEGHYEIGTEYNVLEIHLTGTKPVSGTFYIEEAGTPSLKNVVFDEYTCNGNASTLACNRNG